MPPSKPIRSRAAFKAGTPCWPPMVFANGVSRRCSARASSMRPLRTRSRDLDAGVGHDTRERKNRALRAGHEAREVGDATPGEDEKVRARLRHVVGQERRVTAGLLEADDIRMFGEQADGIRGKRDAGVHRHVVEQHRHRALFGHGHVVLDVDVGRHHVLEERGRPHEHGIDAVARRALACRDRRLGRLGPRARNERACRGHRRARRGDHAVRFTLVEQHGFSVGPQHDQPREPRLHVAFDVARNRRVVHRVLAKRRDDRRVDTWERSHVWKSIPFGGLRSARRWAVARAGRWSAARRGRSHLRARASTGHE